MMKLTHFLKSRRAVSEKLLPVFTSQAGMSSARPESKGNSSSSIYADCTFYKGKAALTMSPLMPKFSKLNSGSFKIDKKGVLLLSFSPAIGERKYDFEKKQMFALSTTEIGSLISLGPGKSCEFFHDPSMKSSNAGQVRKTLTVTPMSEDGGYFFTISVVNGILKTNERYSVPITKAEFSVICTACSYILPHIMGWDQYTNDLPAAKSTNVNPEKRSEMRVDMNMNDEWDR